MIVLCNTKPAIGQFPEPNSVYYCMVTYIDFTLKHVPISVVIANALLIWMVHYFLRGGILENKCFSVGNSDKFTKYIHSENLYVIAFWY
jgi:hypothetical protein